ncbi:MAG: ribonuclease III, partial [Desulfovibrionaceae bacterium]|nr:ribonuclease III [Desulfovibrionaceae bacterium]
MKTLPTISQEDVLQLEQALDYHFRDRTLLDRALTHSSYANEFGLGAAHNERQEFLGDAVLELCVSWELYTRFPSTREGDLTRLRSALVNTGSFAQRAREVGLNRMILLGRGEEGQGGRKRDSVLSDVFEAVLGAVYEDGGFAAAQHVIGRVFKDVWPADPSEGKKELDHKTHLQEC